MLIRRRPPPPVASSQLPAFGLAKSLPMIDNHIYIKVRSSMCLVLGVGLTLEPGTQNMAPAFAHLTVVDWGGE